MSGDTRLCRLLDDLLELGEYGLTEAEWNTLVKIAPDLARSLAAAGEGLRAERWKALERLLALLPPGGGSLDERFAALQAPEEREPGDPVHPDEFKWLMAGAWGVLIGWHGTAPDGAL